MERIEAVLKQRWGLEGKNKKKKSGDEEEESEDGLRKSQEERTLSSTSC